MNHKKSKDKKPSKKDLAFKKAQKHVRKLQKNILTVNNTCKKNRKPVKIVIIHKNKTKSQYRVVSVTVNLPKRTGSTISFHPIDKKGKEMKEVMKKISYIKKLKIKK